MQHGLLFLLLAAGLAWLGFSHPVPLVRLLAIWTATAFLWVAIGHLGLGSRVFGKRADGSVSPICITILAPYLLAGMLSVVIYQVLLRESALNRLTDRLYFGRRLLGFESRLLEEHGVVAVLDLTGGFPEPMAVRSGRAYRSISLLDTTSPSLDLLDDAVQWIVDHSKDGPVYVHCAMGHGRAGLVAGAYLLATGEAADVEDCLRMMRNARPLVKLSNEQHRRLREYAEQRREQPWEPKPTA
jgi:hypothetical protein